VDLVTAEDKGYEKAAHLYDLFDHKPNGDELLVIEAVKKENK
jgi:hypothetical protein